MMFNVDALKDQLIDSLWLPKVREGGSSFYPKRRKHKQMKLFTLTNGTNFNEIIRLIEERLVQGNGSVAWVNAMMKRGRLEAEAVLESVFDGSVYDDSFLSFSCPLFNCFAFDVVNLDFSSQEPELNEGRIEQEIKSLEKTINFQKQKGAKRFVLIYTTIIDSNAINKDRIIQTSNSMTVQGWQGLDLSSTPLLDLNGKKNLLKEIVSKICEKYGYRDGQMNDATHNINNSQYHLYSVSGIFTG